VEIVVAQLPFAVGGDGIFAIGERPPLRTAYSFGPYSRLLVAKTEPIAAMDKTMNRKTTRALTLLVEKPELLFLA
jgi:hypothetical protein